jgi:hypothetical protein
MSRSTQKVVQPADEPAAPGTATFDSATRTLSIPAMPEHATTICAYRRVLGGDPEPAGISTTTAVSVVEFSPLVPGSSYEFWVVGRNRSAGEGPESNHVSYTAPVGP